MSFSIYLPVGATLMVARRRQAGDRIIRRGDLDGRPPGEGSGPFDMQT